MYVKGVREVKFMQKIILAGGMLLLTGQFLVGTAFAGERKLAEELYVKSGLAEQVEDIGAAILAGYQHNYQRSDAHTDRDEKIHREIGRVVAETFDVNNIRDSVVVGSANDLKSEDLDAALAWLDSPTGQKVTALEKKASSPEGVQGLRDFARNFTRDSVTQERVRLIRELDEALHVTETAVEIALSTQFALSVTVRPKTQTLSRDEIRELYEKFRSNKDQLRPRVQNQVYASLLYTYQDLTDSELKAYLAFASSPGGAEYNRVTSVYLTRAITESCLNFAREIGRL